MRLHGDISTVTKIISEIKNLHLDESKVKKMTEEDRNAINKIVDFVNRYNGVTGFFNRIIDSFSGPPKELIIEYDPNKGNLWNDGGQTFSYKGSKIYNIKYDEIIDEPIKAPQSSYIGSIFKGIENIFGRVDAKTLANKIGHVETKQVSNVNYNDEDRY